MKLFSVPYYFLFSSIAENGTTTKLLCTGTVSENVEIIKQKDDTHRKHSSGAAWCRLHDKIGIHDST